MFTKFIDYLIAIALLGIPAAVTLVTDTPLPSSPQVATPPLSIESPTRAPKEEGSKEVADPVAPEDPLSVPLAENKENHTQNYQGDGSPTPPTPSPKPQTSLAISTPINATQAAAPALSKAASSSTSKSQKQIESKIASDPLPEDRAPGAHIDEGLAAPAYSVTNVRNILPELLDTKNALIAVVNSDAEVYYTQNWEDLRFRLAASPRNLADFNTARFIPFHSTRVHSACAEDFPSVRQSNSEIRIYLSHSLDAQILKAQRDHAKKMELPLEQLASTTGLITQLGNHYGYKIENATARTAR